MIDIKKKNVKFNEEVQIFNYPNEKQALYCGSCKLDDMIDVK